jgi:hypothetical protein
MDDSSPNDIEKFANDLGVNYPILVGEDKVGKRLWRTAVPACHVLYRSRCQSGG